ncbi:partial Copper-exporting P-type ATPase, partial [Anaerolineae bacterium]
MSTQRISFAIQGMRQACVKCAVDIERALTQVNGVVAAQVNYAAERATVVFNPSCVSTATLVRAVRESGFDVPRERIVLNVDGLLYASSAHTVERILERRAGVVQARADFKTQQIRLDVIAERVNRCDCEKAIANLGFCARVKPALNVRRDFGIRVLLLVVLALLSLLSAGAHAGLLKAGILHAPLWVMAISVVVAYGIAWRFYYLAFMVARRGEFDRGVLIALISSISLLVGLLLALFYANSAITTGSFVGAIALTTGWYVTR